LSALLAAQLASCQLASGKLPLAAAYPFNRLADMRRMTEMTWESLPQWQYRYIL
jgi:hypothetical protein